MKAGDYVILSLLVGIVGLLLYIGIRGDRPNTELAKRKESEAIKQCVDAGGIVELLYYEGPGTYYLHACNLTPGRVEVR